MTKTIISIISSVSLLSVGSSAMAEYRNIYGETYQQEVNRLDMEDRLQKIEQQQLLQQLRYQPSMYQHW